MQEPCGRVEDYDRQWPVKRGLGLEPAGEKEERET
jgi:hypothetical protein